MSIIRGHVLLLMVWKLYILTLFASCGTSLQERGYPLDPSKTPIQLYGPDNDNMLECSSPQAFSTDTQAVWYINDQLIKRTFWPHGLRHVYESYDELLDIWGGVPTTMQCRVTDKAVTQTDLRSNMLIWV